MRSGIDKSYTVHLYSGGSETVARVTSSSYEAALKLSFKYATDADYARVTRRSDRIYQSFVRLGRTGSSNRKCWFCRR